MKANVVCDGIAFGEGPVWCDIGDHAGTLVVTSVAEGALYRVWPDENRCAQFADTGGGANGAALAAEGSILVTQNGGIDFTKIGLFDDPPPYRPSKPGLQLATPDGRVSYLAEYDLHAPNDLAIASNGDVYFTDPGHYPPDADDAARVMIYDDNGLRTFATGFYYCNGIAFDVDGHVVVVERQGLQRVFEDGSREWVIETLGPVRATGSVSTPTAAPMSRRRWSTACGSSTVTARSSSSSRSKAEGSPRTAASAVPTCARCTRPTRSRAGWSRGSTCRHRACRWCRGRGRPDVAPHPRNGRASAGRLSPRHRPPCGESVPPRAGKPGSLDRSSYRSAARRSHAQARGSASGHPCSGRSKYSIETLPA
jgi:hypothetical protein